MFIHEILAGISQKSTEVLGLDPPTALLLLQELLAGSFDLCRDLVEGMDKTGLLREGALDDDASPSNLQPSRSPMFDFGRRRCVRP